MCKCIQHCRNFIKKSLLVSKSAQTPTKSGATDYIGIEPMPMKKSTNWGHYSNPILTFTVGKSFLVGTFMETKQSFRIWTHNSLHFTRAWLQWICPHVNQISLIELHFLILIPPHKISISPHNFRTRSIVFFSAKKWTEIFFPRIIIFPWTEV